jgi:hypothetical protein
MTSSRHTRKVCRRFVLLAVGLGVCTTEPFSKVGQKEDAELDRSIIRFSEVTSKEKPSKKSSKQSSKGSDRNGITATSKKSSKGSDRNGITATSQKSSKGSDRNGVIATSKKSSKGSDRNGVIATSNEFSKAHSNGQARSAFAEDATTVAQIQVPDASKLATVNNEDGGNERADTAKQNEIIIPVDTVELPPLSLSSNCFFIMSTDTKAVIKESNSWRKVKIDDNYSNHSLSELAELENNYVTRSYFSGITAVIQYVNDSNCKFTVAISGINAEPELLLNVSKIKAWLNGFSKRIVYKKGTVIARIPVLYGEQDEVDIVVVQDLSVILPKISRDIRLKKDLLYKSFVVAPVGKGHTVGNVNVAIGQWNCSSDLVTDDGIARVKMIGTMVDSLKYIFMGVPN